MLLLIPLASFFILTGQVGEIPETLLMAMVLGGAYDPMASSRKDCCSKVFPSAGSEYIVTRKLEG